MKHSGLKLGWAALLLFLAGVPGVNAKTFSFPDLNCTFETPDNWIYRDRGGDLVNTVDEDYSRRFRIHTTAEDASQSVSNPQTISHLEKSLIARGFSITGRQTLWSDGTEFYQWKMSHGSGDRIFHYTAYFAVAHGFGYYIECCKLNDNPDNDADLQAMLKSVAF